MIDNLNFTTVKEKEKVSHLVLNSLKEALVRGQLEPGDRLPSMAELASDMGVGVSSVREAIKMLEALDVLKTKQGEGTFVNSDFGSGVINAFSLQLILLPRSVKELVEFRRMYETAYTMLAMEQATEKDLKIIENIVTDLENEIQYREPSSEDELRFHRAVLDCTHNIYVIKTGEGLLELFQSTIPKIGKVLNKYNIAQDHRQIYEALKNKNRESMNQVLQKSFSGWEVRLEGKNF
ncbi:FadR/GntR family transcriptional regulator [Massiliimalia massiliensis]|uniref:FadR/GntR family transcriptional regulator n=1 Tax=Massiliimalia massiliensis TaxID=1852384 RepID=UPI0009870521|nr:FadR/GntR family transcriptional regulator [Massiliimalia massiliensis]